MWVWEGGGWWPTVAKRKKRKRRKTKTKAWIRVWGSPLKGMEVVEEMNPVETRTTILSYPKLSWQASRSNRWAVVSS